MTHYVFTGDLNSLLWLCLGIFHSKKKIMIHDSLLVFVVCFYLLQKHDHIKLFWQVTFSEKVLPSPDTPIFSPIIRAGASRSVAQGSFFSFPGLRSFVGFVSCIHVFLGFWYNPHVSDFILKGIWELKFESLYP